MNKWFKWLGWSAYVEKFSKKSLITSSFNFASLFRISFSSILKLSLINIVCCDLVEESILGGQHVQVLKYFPKKRTTENRVDWEFNNNDFVKLNLKNFDQILNRIADISGKTIECNPVTPTRMQLMFVNTNSQWKNASKPNPFIKL